MGERQTIETLTLSDGRVLKLIGDMNALCDYERVMTAAGFDPMRELQSFEAGRGGGFSVSRALFWAFAQEHQPELTLRECGRIIQSEGARAVDAVIAAMQRAMPAAEPGVGDADPVAAPGKTPPQTA